MAYCLHFLRLFWAISRPILSICSYTPCLEKTEIFSWLFTQLMVNYKKKILIWFLLYVGHFRVIFVHFGACSSYLRQPFNISLNFCVIFQLSQIKLCRLQWARYHMHIKICLFVCKLIHINLCIHLFSKFTSGFIICLRTILNKSRLLKVVTHLSSSKRLSKNMFEGYDRHVFFAECLHLKTIFAITQDNIFSNIFLQLAIFNNFYCIMHSISSQFCKWRCWNKFISQVLNQRFYSQFFHPLVLN